MLFAVFIIPVRIWVRLALEIVKIPEIEIIVAMVDFTFFDMFLCLDCLGVGFEVLIGVMMGENDGKSVKASEISENLRKRAKMCECERK